MVCRRGACYPDEMFEQSTRALRACALLALGLATSQCSEAPASVRALEAQPAGENAAGNAGAVPASASDPNVLPEGGGAAPRTNEQTNPVGLAEAPPMLTMNGTGTDAGGAPPPSDRCDVGVYNPDAPPKTLTLSGSLGAHDPVIIAAGGRYHYFSTGNGISVKTSSDLLRWTQEAAVFPTTPAWFAELVPAYAPRNIWAPDISYFGEQYHLYYSVSSFGSNRSCIGHATRADLDTGSWTDHEAVFCSNQPGQNDNYNAIDPNVVLDEAGTPWLSFGSFWSGIKLIQLDQQGARSGTDLYSLASRGGGAIEGPFIVRRCGYYYLFVSFDACCRGADSTYNLRVGRARELLGPYVDRAGTGLLNGGGSLVLQQDSEWVGPGHNAILIEGSRAYNVYHAYAATNGASQLRISELAWDADGWPVSAGP
jgi:arabinan endo-1,5-alpha-L-arabinosidase